MRQSFEEERAKLAALQRKSAQKQAGPVLQLHAMPKVSPTKVKVMSGSTASRQRVPVGYIPPLTAEHMTQRRKYSDYLTKTKMGEIDTRQRCATVELMKNYCDTLD